MIHWFPSTHQSDLLRYRSPLIVAIACCFVLILPVTVTGQVKIDETKVKENETSNKKTILYAPLSAAELKSQLQSWTVEQKLKNPDQLKLIANLLAKLDTPLTTEEKMNLTMRVFSVVSPDTRQLFQTYQLSENTPQLSSHPLLIDGKAESFYLSNVRYYVARNMTQFRMVDHSLEIFESIKPDNLVDPAGYLFFKAICEHQLLQKKACEKTLDQLLNRTESVPERYTQVAILMQADLADLKEESLNEISRKMSDVERRLELGNSGKKVQKVEDEIIASLDKLIKQMEDQSKNSPSSGSGAGSSNSPNGGTDESRVKGQTAPGEIDKKKLSANGGWGQLPPKKQASAKNIINRNFPSHYRKAIEKYFKKLAAQKVNSSK